jgi:protein gp37
MGGRIVSDNSKIEWTDATWNPLRAKNPETGKLGHHCVKISPACTHCYAASMNKRLGTNLDYSSSSPAETFIDEVALFKPREWKRPRKVFVCSMTDLFGEWIEQKQIDRVFAMMALCPQHTFQVLTKRPERMQAYVSDPETINRVHLETWHLLPDTVVMKGAWPLINVQLGVTAENLECADERIPWLLKTPAAVRFLSCEPLLGPIDLRLGDSFGVPTAAEPCRELHWLLHWIIAGGESGQQARPMHPDWARSLRDQCQAAGVPFFFKQWGEWVPWVGQNLNDLPLEDASRHIELMADGTIHDKTVGHGGSLMARVGKKKADRLLDGREWNEFPTAVDAAVA